MYDGAEDNSPSEEHVVTNVLVESLSETARTTETGATDEG